MPDQPRPQALQEYAFAFGAVGEILRQTADALERYGSHRDYCRTQDQAACTCGLAEALKASQRTWDPAAAAQMIRLEPTR